MGSLKDKKTDLEKQFQNIKNSAPPINPGNHLVEDEDMPDFGEIEIYDYESDVLDSLEVATDVIDSLADLYLGDDEKIKNHRYIQNKMADDAEHYAEAKLLSKITRKTLIQILRQVDNGDNSARMYEVVNQTIKSQQDNNKYLSGVKTDIEKFYRGIRKDLGLTELGESPAVEGTGEEGGNIIDTRDLNDQINDILKKKKE